MKNIRQAAFFKRFQSDEQGSVLILFGIGVVMLLAISGASIDLGAQQLMRAKLQHSSDAAATSAASLRGTGVTIDEPMRTVAAQRYFELNYPAQFYGAPRPVPAITVGSGSVAVNANGQVPTTFVNNFGISVLEAEGSSTVSYLNDVTQQTSDIVLVLDVSGSMMGARTTALKATSADFVTDVLTNNPDNRIGIILWSNVLVGTMPFSNDLPATLAYIEAINPINGAGTNSTKGMEVVATAMPFREDVVKAIILMTDGGNNTPNPWNSQTLTHCTSQKAAGTQIYTIAFGNDVTYPCRISANATLLPSNVAISTTFCTSDTPAADLNGPYCRLNQMNLVIDTVTVLQTEIILNGVTYTLPANIPHPGTFSYTDTNYCIRPFLEACASNASNFYMSPNATALAAAFNAISSNIAAIRIIQ